MPQSTNKSLALRSTAFGIGANFALALIKGGAGYLGNSYALIADAIESTSDIFTSLIVFFGLKLAGKPADENHPYGHGKFEPLAAAMVALILVGAAIVIAIASLREIVTPHHPPAPFTLAVLLGVIIAKELLFRRTNAVGKDIGSVAVRTDAWHHRSDAITSAAAFVGISIALIGGPGYESADDFAALFAAVIIAINALILLKPALFELIDTAPDPNMISRIREIASTVPGVLGTHKCHVRKLGFDFFVDLDVLCNPESSIREGHDTAHDVGEAIQKLLPQITRILVHVEPADDYGRRNITLALIFALFLSTWASYAQAQDDKIKIGVTSAEPASFTIGALLSLTGDCADVGDLSRKGIELAQEEINKSGGILGQPAKLILEDSNETSSARAVSAYQRLILNPQIHYIIGPTCSPAALALAPLVARNQAIIMSSPSVGQRQFNEAGENIFKFWPYDEEGPKLLARYAHQMGWKKVAIFSSQQSWEQQQGIYFEDEFKKLGGEVLVKVEPLTSDTDLRSSALKIVHSKPEFVVLTNYTKYEIAARVLAAQGYHGPKLSSPMSEEKVALAEGTLAGTVSYGYQPASAQFIDLFKARYGKAPWGFSADSAYDIMHLYADTINSAKTADPLVIRKKLLEVKNYPGASGTLSIDLKGGVTKKPILFRVEGLRLLPLE